MIFKLLSYLCLIIYIFLYNVNNYSNLVDIMGNSILMFFILGLIYYHFDIKNKSKKMIAFCLILSIICSFFTFEQLTYSYKKKYIEIKNVSNNYVVISAIYINNLKQPIKHKYEQIYDEYNRADLRTAYQLYNKTDDRYKATLKPDETLKLNIKNKKNINIEIQKSSFYENSLLINNNFIKVKKANKNMTVKGLKIYNPKYNYKYNNINKNISLLNICFVFLITTFVYLNIFIRIITEKKGILLFFPILLVEVNPYININLITKIILLPIYLLLIMKFYQKCEFNSKFQKLIVILLSIYLSFSFVGSILINEVVNAKMILIFILFCIWIYNLFPVFLNCIKKIKFKGEKFIDKKNIIHRVTLFVLVILVCFIYHIAFYPFIVTTDGYMQLQNIFSNTLENWHPYIHTLLIKLFYLLFGDVKYFIYFRFIVYSLILNSILFYFNKKGLSLLKVYLIAILFTLLPVTGIYLVTMWKDIDFSLGLLYLTFLLYLLLNDFEYFNKNKLNYLNLILSLLTVGLFRHNSILAMYVALVIVLFVVIKYKRKLLLICFMITILINFIVCFPLEKELNVKKGPRNVDISTMLHGLNRLIYTENPKLDSSIYGYLVSKVPLKYWKYSYDKYNIDLMLHYQEVVIRDVKFNKNKIIFSYLKQFIKTPIELIKDRLYGTDIIWNVGERDNVMTYKYQILYDEFESNYAKEFGINIDFNFLTNFFNKFLVFISNNEILNILFFRVGIYINILILLFVYSCFNNEKSIFICLFPFFTNIITLLLVMHHYEYRYVWNIELITLLFVLIFIYHNQENS